MFPMTKKMRLDQMLVDRGLVESRTRAQALVMAGLVFSGEQKLAKPGQQLPVDAPLDVRGRDHPWVSRGGIKLAHEGANPPMHGFLFGEDQSRYLIAARKEDAIAILQDAKADEIPVQVVGLAGGTAISVNGAHPLELDRLRAAWEGWMPGLMDQLVEAAE